MEKVYIHLKSKYRTHTNSRSHEIEDRSTIGVCTVIIFCEFKNCERIREINTYCINTNCVYDHNKKYVLFLRIFLLFIKIQDYVFWFHEFRLYNNFWNTYISWHTASKITNNFSIRIAEQNFICITHIVIVISGISIHIFIHFKRRKSNLPITCIVCGGLKKQNLFYSSFPEYYMQSAF